MRLLMVAFVCLGTSCCFGTNLVKSMTLEEKVGQVLMVHFNGEEVNDDAKSLVQETKVGSIIYYNWSNGLTSPPKVKALSQALQNLAKENRIPVPLLIATDQEGGIVARLQSGFTIFPGNRALGETADPNLAMLSARAMGQQMQSVGVNMNLAPVVDVNSNPQNPVIGVRSFGDDPDKVVAFAENALTGFRQANVITTLKHFPGHGDVSVDSHEDLPVVSKSLPELEQVELLPFAKLASSADAIMTAHILVPALDAENCSTLSERTLSYLRNVIGFKGVIVSDSLVMEGVLKRCQTVDEASIAALNAGCDLLILGGKFLVGEKKGFELTAADIKRLHHSIVEAVKSGRIAEKKLDCAVERILVLKERLQNTQNFDDVDTSEHQKLACKIATLALRIQERKSHKISFLSDQKILVVSPSILQSALQNTSIYQIGKHVKSSFFETLSPSDSEGDDIRKQAMSADVVIVCSYNAWKNPSAAALTQSLLAMEKPVIVLTLRDPLDSALFPDADLIMTSFSPTAPSVQAICDHLTEKYK